MINMEKVKVEKEVIESVICDSCGKTIKPSTDFGDDLEYQEMLFIKFTGGYASIFGDMTTMETQLCQHCVRKLLGGVLRISEEDD